MIHLDETFDVHVNWHFVVRWLYVFWCSHWGWGDRLSPPSLRHAPRLSLQQRRVHRRRRDCTSGPPPHIVGVSVTYVPFQRLVTAVFQVIDGNAQFHVEEVLSDLHDIFLICAPASFEKFSRVGFWGSLTANSCGLTYRSRDPWLRV